MKVILKQRKITPFEEVEIGKCFLILGDVHIKIKERGVLNCVNLSTGNAYSLSKYVGVSRINIEIVEV